jgi:uncharacterized protein (TIGR00369 family)
MGVAFGLARKDQVAGLSGREILQAMIDGTLPAPTICEPLSFLLREVGDGFAMFEGETSSRIMNPLGTVHGGWALTIIDSATGCAAMSILPPGVGYTTVETKANFVRPILADTGRVRCMAHLLARGRQIITAEARITDSNEKLLAHGSSTMIVLPPGGNSGR